MLRALGKQREKSPQANKGKVPWDSEPVHNFLQKKKKVPFPETERYANSSGGTCVHQMCCFVKQKTPTKQKASPAAFFSSSSFRYIHEQDIANILTFVSAVYFVDWKLRFRIDDGIINPCLMFNPY